MHWFSMHAHESGFMERRDYVTRFGWLGRFIFSMYLRREPQKRKMLLKNIPKTTVLLDGGCGWGIHSGGFEDRTCWLIGLDIVKKHLIAYRKCIHNNVSCILASLDCLPFRPNSFDGCVLQDSLEHTNNPLNVLVQIQTILSPYGTLVATVPNWFSFFLDANPFSAKTHHHFHSPLGWKKFIQRAGFQNCDVSSIAFPILNLPFLARHFHIFGIGMMLRAQKIERARESVMKRTH